MFQDCFNADPSSFVLIAVFLHSFYDEIQSYFFGKLEYASSSVYQQLTHGQGCQPMRILTHFVSTQPTLILSRGH